MTPSKVVLVTDWITITGGGEKVVEQFHKLYPEAPIYTSYCSDAWRERLHGKVITGYLQHWPFSKLRRFLPVLRQHWFGHLDLKKFDTIISISGNGEAKFVKKSDKQLHISYCHTPPHFYWAQYNEYLEHPSMRPYWLARLGLRLLVKPLRKRDYAAAQAVDHFIANSTAIQADIMKFYGRDSTIIYPPVDAERFSHLAQNTTEHTVPTHPKCIWWGRIVPAKRLDVIIEACNQLSLPLTIIGSGPAAKDLQTLAGPTVTFTGYVSDDERDNLIKQADVFLFPSKEDFGVAPVEALAAGLPVIAYKAGGALDYIQEGANGLFFAEQTSESLAQTLQNLPATFDTKTIVNSVERFSAMTFDEKVSALMKRLSR